MAVGAFALLAACAHAPEPPREVLPARELSPLEQALHTHVAELASDRYGGREVGTEGEALTLDYLQAQLEAAGLESGTHDPGHDWRKPFSFEGRRKKTVQTHNIIGRLPGTGPRFGAVLLVAHWDHLGQGRECRRHRGDRICNGAIDNASGLAMMIEIARQLAKGPRPVRDIYFLASGGEEAGLKGAYDFTADPPVPLDKFVAVFNLDTEGLSPPSSPAVVLAGPRTEGLMELIDKTANDTGVTLVAPNERNLAFLKRQDGWAFAVNDVPAVIVSAAFADDARFAAFLDRDYHRASDGVEHVELGAAADMVAFHVALITRAASPATLPQAPRDEISANDP
ncbi:M28 family peptidase [Croceicoccus gelatinilyticus]|uniref:M28 family peptidase n=1 Tax=Croceicoccus gelatinilyticus TaxID=2835536 RepID=UPI001BCE2CAE|nr:M28 family peptidase [Croceicoccus gelatinilyticus]MBS7670463.1 M20/M25/M40 family metallo-hydrolase [Croceicoccus gelatinilyticus]